MPVFPISDHCDGRRFFNPDAPTGKSLREVLRWMLLDPAEPWPTAVATPSYAPPPSEVAPGACAITFVNHCTFLLQWAGLRVLTDPVFSNRASPVAWAGPKRVTRPGLTIDALPPVDVVLVSHNHYDHLDAASLRAIVRRDQPLLITPLGNARVLRRLGASRVEELDWWQHATHASLDVQATPAQHWSNRMGVRRNTALWGGFWLRVDGWAVYFAADTGYGPHFQAIAERCGVPDVSLLPIGAYEPRRIMRDQHMDPAEAVRAHLDLRSRLSIATHFGTFRLTNESYDAPVRTLALERARRGVAPDRFKVLGIGETIGLQATGCRL